MTTFEKSDGHSGFGQIHRTGTNFNFKNNHYIDAMYRLLRCAGCGRGGIAVLLGGNYDVLFDFYPKTIDALEIPDSIPQGIEAEFREAELCCSVGAWRAASALLRSTLEKTLKANGYTKGTLEKKIDEATSDGVLTAARKQRAHDEIRVLGNEVVHDEWREVTPEEVEMAHHYTQRILEDFYDDRDAVEAILKKKKRISDEGEGKSTSE